MELSDPTLVFLLVILGLTGISIEVLTPGGIFSGLVGVIALVFGVIGAIDIGASPVGIGFLIVSIACFVAAVALKLYRPLSVAGILALMASGIWMFPRDTDPTSIPAVILGAAAIGGFLAFVIERVSRTKASPVMYGPEELIGMTGDVRQSLSPRGQVFIDGALWQAETTDPGEHIAYGEQIRVVALNGLTLSVSRADDDSSTENPNTEIEGAGQ